MGEVDPENVVNDQAAEQECGDFVTVHEKPVAGDYPEGDEAG